MNGVALRNALDLLLDDAGRHRADEAADSWGGLVQLIQNNCQTHEDLGLVASVLLITEDSLLQFLTNSLEQQGAVCVSVTQCVCLWYLNPTAGSKPNLLVIFA